MGALSSILHDMSFRGDLNRRGARPYEEFLEHAGGYINAEETSRLAHSKASQATNVANNADQANGEQNNKRRKGNGNNAEAGQGSTVTKSDSVKMSKTEDLAHCKGMTTIMLCLRL